jgi:hypothetical protein
MIVLAAINVNIALKSEGISKSILATIVALADIENPGSGENGGGTSGDGGLCIWDVYHETDWFPETNRVAATCDILTCSSGSGTCPYYYRWVGYNIDGSIWDYHYEAYDYSCS